MNNEAKTITPGQAFQLLAVIAQQLGKIGLTFEIAEQLIGKPAMTRSRLKGLLGSVRSTPVAASKQYTELERLDVSLYEGHRSEDAGEYLVLSHDLSQMLDQVVNDYTSNDRCWSYRCDIIRSTSDVGLWPVFREVLQHEGADNEIWGILYKRHALWTVGQVLGFLRDDIHQGDDKLGLTEHKREVIFPVLLTETPHQNGSPRRSDRVGFLLVHQGRPIHQRRVWGVALVEGDEIFSFEREMIYFANNPGPADK